MSELDGDSWRRVVEPEQESLLRDAALIDARDVSSVSRLRKRWDAGVVSVALELVEARRKLVAKGIDAAGWLADRAGAEMASSRAVSLVKARRFGEQDHSRVLDLCCGIGGDLATIAEVVGADRVEGVDLDAIRVWMAAQNTGCVARVGDVEQESVRGALVHFDPSRRGRDGARRFALPDYLPGPDAMARVANGSLGAAIKLAPGVDDSDLETQVGAGELMFVSEGGTLTQAVLWTGCFERARRSCVRIARDGSVASLAGEGATRGDPLGSVPRAGFGRFVYVVDPAAERSGLLGEVARDAGIGMVHPLSGVFSGDERIESAWLTGYEVLERFRWGRSGEKRVRGWLASRGGGDVHVKARGGLVDTDSLARRLRGRGGSRYTLMLVRAGDEVEALMCEAL